MVDTVLGDNFKSFYDRYENAKDNYERKKLLDLFFIGILRKKFSKRSDCYDLNESLYVIRQNNGNIKISSLIKRLGISERKLELIFGYTA
jgi:hypothetical protein